MPLDVRTKEGALSRERGADPLAICSLPPQGLQDRVDWVRRELLPHALATQRIPDGRVFEFAATPGLSDALDRLVALEAQCCSSLAFESRPGAAEGRLRLEIHGVDPDAAIFDSIALQEVSPKAGAPAPATRFAKALGFGVAASLFVCCVVPIGAAAVLGGLAAPLAGFDAPGPIAAGALLASGGAWWWLGRGRHPAA